MDDRKILENSPLPIARGYRRYRNASEVRERHDAAYYLFEVYLKYVAAVAIAQYLAGEARDHRVNAALKGLARPSLGEWLRFLRECLRFLGDESEADPAVQAAARLFESKESRWQGVVGLYNCLRSFRTGSASERDKVSLGMLLEELVPYRNRVLGHGAPLRSEHYEKYGGLLGPAYPELLGESPFLTARQLVSFQRPQVLEGSKVECGIIEFMGVHPLRRDKPLSLPYGAPAPHEDALHLLHEDGSFLSLDPLLIAHNEDVYILNEAGGTPEYLSYSTGDRHKPTGVEDAQQKLFERILGYQVDSTRLSRIGEDLAKVAPPEKPLEEGEKKLGDYRIVREIGRGGMGAVFEAIQESLGRRVALKVLPGTFALDSERLERFRREARATARIHHPNIVPVYEVGEAEGNHYYAMEYVDGPSLEELLCKARNESKGDKKSPSASDPTYIANVVEQMAALAEGLEQAHKQGLVHRDVKPSNVLVDKDGRYILVDFGLVHEEEAETITRSGELIGTLSYMSPEQVSRRKVDARSDVYSLGATLYEALTLQPPFSGESDVAIQNAILFNELTSPRKLNLKLNRDLETILVHALEKNPERRYASAGEMAADLGRFLKYEPILARPPSTLSKLRRSLWRHRQKAALVALILLMAVVATMVVQRLTRVPRITLVNVRQLTLQMGLATEPSLSPDGTFVVFASDRSGRGDLDIWLQSVDGKESKRLTSHPADDREPALSPDGERIAFASERDGGGVYVIPVQGGKPHSAKLLVRGGQRPRFSPDGEWIAYWVGMRPSSLGGKIYVVPSNGGVARQLQPQLPAARYPVWSPDGESLLFLGSRERGLWISDARDWWTTSLDGGEPIRTGVLNRLQALGVPHVAVTQLAPGTWVSHGGRVFLSCRWGDAGCLWSIEIATRVGGSVRSDPQVLTPGSDHGAHPWCDRSGRRLVFSRIATTSDLWCLRMNPDKPVQDPPMERLTHSVDIHMLPAVSEDGLRCVYTSSKHAGQGRHHVYLLDIAKDTENRLTDRPSPHWGDNYITRDGSVVGFVGVSPEGEPGHCRRDLTTETEEWFPVQMRCFSPDGQIGLRREGNSLVLLDLKSKSERKFMETPEGAMQETFSPDAHWLAVVANSAGGELDANRILVAKTDSAGPLRAVQITQEDGWHDKPRWSPDGCVLYFVANYDGHYCIWAQRLDPQTKKPEDGGLIPVKHFHTSSQSLANLRLGQLNISIARDKLVFNMGRLTGNIWMAELEEE